VDKSVCLPSMAVADIARVVELKNKASIASVTRDINPSESTMYFRICGRIVCFHPSIIRKAFAGSTLEEYNTGGKVIIITISKLIVKILAI